MINRMTNSSPPTEPTAAPSVIPAATIVIFRKSAVNAPPELLMVQRSKSLRFAGGAAVFPGGKIDPSDIALSQSLQSQSMQSIHTTPAADPLDMAARIAGIRETLEETGLAIGLSHPVTATEAAEGRRRLLDQGDFAPVLASMNWQLAPDILTPFARWCPMRDGSFDTRFYLADLGTGAVDIAVDATENTRLFWASAADSLTMANTGDISVIFPTRRNLERLAQFASFAEAQTHANAIPIQTISPKTIERDGESWLTLPSGLGYPITEETMTTVKRG